MSVSSIISEVVWRGMSFDATLSDTSVVSVIPCRLKRDVGVIYFHSGRVAPLSGELSFMDSINCWISKFVYNFRFPHYQL